MGKRQGKTEERPATIGCFIAAYIQYWPMKFLVMKLCYMLLYFLGMVLPSEKIRCIDSILNITLSPRIYDRNSHFEPLWGVAVCWFSPLRLVEFESIRLSHMSSSWIGRYDQFCNSVQLNSIHKKIVQNWFGTSTAVELSWIVSFNGDHSADLTQPFELSSSTIGRCNHGTIRDSKTGDLLADGRHVHELVDGGSTTWW